MSKNDMLALIARILYGVPREEWDVILDVVNKIRGVDGELWYTRLSKVLREDIRETILEQEVIITFPARDDPIDPNEFFSRPNVDCSDSFRREILPALRLVANTPKRIYGAENQSCNYDISSNLPNYQLSNWEDIASLIEMYPNGKCGYHFFKLKGVDDEAYAVRVHWNFYPRQWCVNIERIGKRGKPCEREHPDIHVLFPSNETS